MNVWSIKVMRALNFITRLHTNIDSLCDMFFEWHKNEKAVKFAGENKTRRETIKPFELHF